MKKKTRLIYEETTDASAPIQDYQIFYMNIFIYTYIIKLKKNCTSICNKPKKEHTFRAKETNTLQLILSCSSIEMECAYYIMSTHAHI